MLFLTLFSSYRYYTDKKNRHYQERDVDSRKHDVLAFAGNAASKDNSIYYHEHDKLELDNNKRVRLSQGKAVLEIKDDKAAVSSSTDDKIPDLGAVSDYKLEFSQCTAGPSKTVLGKLSAALASRKCAVGDLLATMDKGKFYNVNAWISVS